MSGVDARRGFWFQDARILVRLLRDALSRRVARLSGDAIPAPVRIRIEAATEVEANAQPPALPRPLWDSVAYQDASVIVDETKLGDVSKEERLAFYARVRATVEAPRSTVGIIPRLTTAAGAQKNEEKWRGLAGASATASIPPAPPENVTTATELAQEALFYLTSPLLPSRKRNDRGVLVDATTLPMSEVDARNVLGRFIFDDELDYLGTEGELRRLLGELGGEYVIVDESIRQLRGWIAEKACVRPEGAEMTCETLGDEIRVLARYLNWNAESELLAQRIRAAAPPRIETRLAPRTWREVQPAAAKALSSAAGKRLVFVASGGVGKSFALSQLHGELSTVDFCLWIEATNRFNFERLAEAVTIAAWASKRRQQRLVVLIDGLDHEPDALGLLSTVDAALAGYDDAEVISAARPTTWSGIHSASRIWCEIRLELWATDAVLAIPFAAALPPDLVDLLRTPLFLDLYLRTLGDADLETFQPRSRHELIAEYFLRCILPPDSQSSPIRRALIEKLGARVADGQLQWTLEPADVATAGELGGEGLLIDAFGRHRFRHSLLQDIAVAITVSSSVPEQCAASVLAMKSSTLRHDVSRGLIEAATATGPRRALLETPPLQDLLRSFLGANLPALDALGDVVVGASELPLILGNGGSLAQILRWARSAGNRSWLHALAKQPVFPRPRWLQAAALDKDLFELAHDINHTALPDGVRRDLAVRLRSWAARDLQPLGWAAATVIRAVIHQCPTAETLLWLDSLSALPETDTCDLLSGLRLIGAHSRDMDEELDDEKLARVVLAGFDNVGLGRGGPRPWSGDEDEGTTRVIMGCLQAEDKTPGLFETRPRAAYRVLFELVARHGEARQRERVERSKDPAHIKMLEEIGRLLSAGQDSSTDEIVELPTESSEVVEVGVVNDVPPIGWHPRTYPLHGIWVSAARRLQDPAIMEIAKDEAAKSRSLSARNLVAGKDAKVTTEREWVVHERSPWPDDPLPANTPEHISRAWHLLEIIVRARSNGTRSSYVSGGTLRAVLASVDLLATTPTWALQSLHIVISDFTKHADQGELALWCERILEWLERGPIDHVEAVGAFECFEECFFGLQDRDPSLVERFATVFDRQLEQSTPLERAKLFFSAHRMAWYPALADQLLRFARSHPAETAVEPIWIAVANVPNDTFGEIARELVALSPHRLPERTRAEIGTRLGAASCYPTNEAVWSMLNGCLEQRPDSGTCRRDDDWRSLLDSVANGATHHATEDVARYVEVATRLWHAWAASPSESVHGLVFLLFACIAPARGEARGALVEGLTPLTAEIVAAGDAFDLLGLKNVPWSEMRSHDFDVVVECLITRLAAGPPEPDKYRRVAAALDDLVESIARSNALNAKQAERLYAVVQPAAWMLNREARCQELQACARSRG